MHASHNARVCGCTLQAMASYGVGWTPKDVAQMAMWFLKYGARYGFESNLTDTQIQQVVCSNFTVTHVQYLRGESEWGPTARCPVQWDRKGQTMDCNANASRTMGGHNKLYFVDERAFYLGSQNLYPNNLAEWGVIVDDKLTTMELQAEFWEPLWDAGITSLHAHSFGF